MVSLGDDDRIHRRGPLRDLDVVVGSGLAGVLVPQVRGAEEIVRLDEQLSVLSLVTDPNVNVVSFTGSTTVLE